MPKSGTRKPKPPQSDAIIVIDAAHRDEQAFARLAEPSFDVWLSAENEEAFRDL